MKNKKTQLILSILMILALVMITIGVTYAFFNYQKEGETVNSLRTGRIIFNSTNDTGTVFRIENALPTIDADGSIDDEHVFDFTITAINSGSQPINYAITARKDATSTLEDSQMKMYLKPVSSGMNANDVNYTYDGQTFNTYNNLGNTGAVSYIGNLNLAQGEEEKVLYKGVVSGNTEEGDYSKNFEFRMWLNGEAGSSANYNSYEYMNISESNASYSDYSVSGCKSNLDSYINANTEAACEAANGTWVTSINIPQTNNTTELDIDTKISNNTFITTQTYNGLSKGSCNDSYKLNRNECVGTYEVARVWSNNQCNDTSKTTENDCTGTYSVNRVWTAGDKDNYEKIAYVNQDDKKVLTYSQALKLGYAKVDIFGNYTFNVSNGTCSDTSKTDKFACDEANGTWTKTANSTDILEINNKTYTPTRQYYQNNNGTFKTKINVYATVEVEGS